MTARPSTPPQPLLFVHSKRKEWGRATPTRAEDEWQMFVFEDGQERKLGKSHLHLLTRVTLAPEEQASVIRALLASRPVASTAQAAKTKKSAAKTAKKAAPAPKRERDESSDED